MLVYLFLTSLFSQSMDEYDVKALQNEGPFTVSVSGYYLIFNVDKSIGPFSNNNSECSNLSLCTVCYYQSYADYCCGETVHDVFVPTEDSTGYSVRSVPGNNPGHDSTLKVLCAETFEITARFGSSPYLEIELSTPYGCPVSPVPPISKKDNTWHFGSIFCIVILVIAVVYFSAGVPIMIFVFKKRGIEVFPFLVQVAPLVREGVLCLLSPICSRGKHTKYDNI